MFDLIVNRTNVNLDQLNQELRAALPTQIVGVSWNDGDFDMRVHFVDDAPQQADLDLAASIVNDHDETVLSTNQQAAADRQAALDAARSQNAADGALDVVGFAGESNPLQLLARKIAWLEQEIDELSST